MGQRKIPFYLQIAVFGIAAGMLVLTVQSLPTIFPHSPQTESYQVARVETTHASCSQPAYGKNRLVKEAINMVSEIIFCGVR